MDAKHTPGPWTVGEYRRRRSDGVHRGIQINGAPMSDGFVPRAAMAAAHPRVSRQQSEANARLIAAAPEMFGDGAFLLDRLDDFEREIDRDDMSRQWAGHVSPAIERFRAAIAKANASS